MKFKYLAIALVAPFLLACQQLVEDVPASSPTVSFERESLNVQAAASEMTVNLTANCDWTISSGADWLQVTPLSGTRATTSVTLSVSENTVEDTPRSGELTLTAKGVTATIKINQAAPVGPIPPGTAIYTVEDFKTFLELAPSFTALDETKVYNDIDLGGATIEPISTYSGVFDGQDHKIYNFKVAADAATPGLFLSNSGTIKNVTFGSQDGKSYDGVSEITAADGKGGSSTGLVAVNNGLLDNVHTFAKVIFKAREGIDTKFGVGGLVGTAGSTEAGPSIIQNCSNHATIETSGTIVVETSFGGVLGYIPAAGTQVLNCTNYANLSVGIKVAKVVMMGGVVGRSDVSAVFDKLVNSGDVSYVQEVAPSTWMSIGGVVGTMYKGCKLTASVNNGVVSSNNQQVIRIGGILGVMNTGGEVSGCTNKGAVTLAQADPNNNWQAAGGIVGFQEKSGNNDKDNVIKDNVNMGNVSMSIENATTHANGVGVGGILGMGSLQLSITGNTNTANVSVVNKGAGAVHAGGICGSLIRNSSETQAGDNVNTGTISASTSDNAAATAGGIVGYIAAATGSDANKGLQVFTNDKNTGDVVCANTAGAGSIAGINGNGKLVDSKVGGTVNGTAVTDANLTALIQGSASTGTYENPTAEGSAPITGKGIKTADDLKAFMTATSYDEWLDGGVVKVLANIDASSIENFQMAEIPAGLVVDGEGHSIFNIKAVSSGATTGMFLVNNGTLKNLKFGTKDGLTYDGVSSVSAAEGKGGSFTGLVAENNGTLEGITTFVTVNYVAGTETAENGVSCLVGHAGESSVVKNCVNKATLNASGNTKQIVDFGTIVGFMDKAGATVTGCSNEVDLVVTMPVKKVLHIGGLIGRINNVVTVDDCHNKAAVTYDQKEAPSTWMSIGGVIGSNYNGGVVSACTNKGAVSANTLQVVRIGGIMGVLNKSGAVRDCVNEGTVTLTQEENANWQSAGGIIGFQEASQSNDKDNIISGNTNKGAVTVSVKNATTHANKVAAGGILGEGCLALDVQNNTNTAAVKVTNAAAGAVYAGGIYGALIKNKYEITSTGNVNTGAVSASTSDNAAAMAGGVVGYIAPSSGGDANTAALTLSLEKNTGAVTCANAAAAGSIAGNNASATLDKCIAGGSVNGTALTAANLNDLVQGSGSKGTASGTTLPQ